MNKLFSKKIGAIGLALIMIFSLVGSMAYFSDYVATDAIGTAGTVALSLDSDINLLDANGKDILNPGDMRDTSFEVTNEGNKSIDVRTTIKLTVESEHYDLVFTGDADVQSEYDLYLKSDVVFVEGEGYKPVEGAKPIEVKSIDGNVITYILPEYSLNGNSDKFDEVETIEGVTDFKKDNDFVLIFKGQSGNTWQDSDLTIDVIVEAKQHENTQAGWAIVAQEQVQHGSISQNVVMGENIITDNGEGSNSNGGTAWFRVTDAEYFTLREAIEAVEDGGTIEIMGEAASASSNIYVIPEDIDAGGKSFTIIAPTNGDGTSTPIEIHNAGTMTGFENVSYSNVTVKEDGYAVYGYGDYYDLQIACDAAESGDIIYVMDDCVVTSDVTSKKELTFMPLNKDVKIDISSVVYVENLNIVGNNGHTITMNMYTAPIGFKNITVGDGAVLSATGSESLLRLDPTNGSATGSATIKTGAIVGDADYLIWTNTLQRLTMNVEAGATVQNITQGICNRNCTKNITDGAIFNNVVGY